MVELNADRLRNVGTARQQWADLLTDAQHGQATHVLRGSQVAAHLLPPNSLVIQDERVLQTMVAAAAQRAIAARLSADSTQSTPQEVADFTIVLRWLKPNPAAHLDALSLYVAALGLHLGTAAPDLTVESVIDSLGGPDVTRTGVASRRDVEFALDAAPALIENARRAQRDPNIFSALKIHPMAPLAQGLEGACGAQRH